MILTGIISVSIGVESWELAQKETIYDAYDKFLIQTIFPACAYDSMPYTRGGVNWYLVCVSYLTFDNARIIPFMLSLSLIPLAYLISKQYTKNNLVGLMASAGLSLDPTMLIFNTSSAFAQTWAVFALGSIYMIRKFPKLATPLICLSIFSKALPIAWAPALLFLIWRYNSGKDRVINLAGFGGIVGLVVGMSVFNGGTPAYNPFVWNDPITWDVIVRGFQWMGDAYRWSWHILAFSLISISYLYKKGLVQKYQELIMFNGVMLAAIPILTILTNEGYFPYRILPNIIFGFIISAIAIHRFIESNVFKTLGTNSVQCAKSP